MLKYSNDIIKFDYLQELINNHHVNNGWDLVNK